MFAVVVLVALVVVISFILVKADASVVFVGDVVDIVISVSGMLVVFLMGVTVVVSEIVLVDIVDSILEAVVFVGEAVDFVVLV